ncbi:MAG: glycogen/starch synthase, partial [Neisseriaceae bacterium]|nr:glycogen/starch synthase [Neisseriaceae bacterium]
MFKKARKNIKKSLRKAKKFFILFHEKGENMKKVLFIASEMTPFIKTGGLGDVVGALPKSLVLKGVQVKAIIPLYSAIDYEKYHLEK